MKPFLAFSEKSRLCEKNSVKVSRKIKGENEFMNTE